MDVAEQMNCVAVILTSNGSMADSKTPLLLFHVIKEKQFNNGCSCYDYKAPPGALHIHMGIYLHFIFFLNFSLSDRFYH